ncbi:MAG: ACT domain-containing protein [Acutalibacteraceae bacterium]|nr:ACT domain-containing protein [Acutalibacteraceae bacterium]
MEKYDMLIVKASALPDVYSKVLYAKELLENGSCTNVSAAAQKAGISRSAFYKYKDCVFAYHKQSFNKNLCISAMLSDRAGVFSALTAQLYHEGANILTINQNHPVDNIAAVTITVRTDNINISIEELMNKLRKIDGVISVKII